jgi:hypothetical protein
VFAKVLESSSEQSVEAVVEEDRKPHQHNVVQRELTQTETEMESVKSKEWQKKLVR